jgi:tetratricopeptide (TPR) repeat protein
MIRFSRFFLCCAALSALGLSLAAPARCAATRDEQKQAHLLYVRALLDEYAGNLENAYDMYEKILSMEPEAYSVQRQAVRVAFNLGRMEKAEDWARALVKTQPDTAENWMLLGTICAAKNDAVEAKADYDKAITLDPSNAEAVYQAAQLFKVSNPPAAIEYLKKYMEVMPEAAPMAYYEMALISYKTGDYKKAFVLLDQSLAKDPAFLQSRYAKAQLFEVKNDTASALAEYREIENRDPQNADLLAHMGEIYAGNNQNDLAAGYFKKALAAEPSEPTSNFWMAIYAEHAGDYKAAAEYVRASANFDKDPSLRLRHSYYLTQNGHYPEAVKELEDAYKKWPDHEDLGYFLALGLDDTNQTAKAVAILKNIVAQKPDYHDARLQYAILAEKIDDIKTAEEQFKILLKASPNDPMLLNYLGYSLADRGMKLDEAEGYVNQAVQAEPGNGAYLDSLAWVYFKKHKLPQAQDQIKKALFALNTDDSVWQHAGDIMAAEGDYRDAWMAYRFSRFIKPDQKGLAASIDKTQKQISSSDLPGLYWRYFNSVAPRPTKYGALCRLTASGGLKSASFDAILSYSTAALSLDLTGPMFTPVMGFHLDRNADGTRSFSVRQGGGDAGELGAIAERLLNMLYDYYSGNIYAAQPQKASGRCLQTADAEICMDDAGMRPQSFTRKDGGKVTLETGYEHTGEQVLPQTLELKSGGLKVRIEITRPSQELAPAHYWLPSLGPAPWDDAAPLAADAAPAASTETVKQPLQQPSSVPAKTN